MDVTAGFFLVWIITEQRMIIRFESMSRSLSFPAAAS